MKTTLLALLLLTEALSLPAQQSDPDLPQPFDPASLAAVINNSPFSRMVSISDSLVLTGIAYIDGKPVATIFNQETKQSSVVSDQPNFQGWTLNEALPAHDITHSQAKINIGGEVVSIRYTSLTPDKMKTEKKSSSGDRGPPPGGGERYSRGSRGPSEEDRKRYESLSDSAKEKFRNMMREKFMDEKFRSAPEEERRNMIRREFDRIEKEDKKR